MILSCLQGQGRLLRRFCFDGWVDVRREAVRRFELAKAEERAYGAELATNTARMVKQKNVLMTIIDGNKLALQRACFMSWTDLRQKALQLRHTSAILAATRSRTVVLWQQGQIRTLRKCCFDGWMDVVREAMRTKEVAAAEERISLAEQAAFAARATRFKDVLFALTRGSELSLGRACFAAWLAMHNAMVRAQGIVAATRTTRRQVILLWQHWQTRSLRQFSFDCWVEIVRAAARQLELVRAAEKARVAESETHYAWESR
jgi:hypothetical protein